MHERDQDGAGRVLSSLREAHNMLSVEQIADRTGIDKGAVEAHLIGLRLRGLAHCAGHEFERDRRVKVVTWKAARPDPA